METTADLNSRWWYRLIKVTYLMFLLITIIAISTGIVFSYGPEYDNAKSYIKCANGNNFILSESDINLYSDFMWDSDKEKAQDLCFYGSLFGKNLSFEAFKEARALRATEDISKYEYELVSVYKSRNWPATIGFSLLSTLGTLLFFELIRRIFYYIVLGSIRPKKT